MYQIIFLHRVIGGSIVGKLKRVLLGISFYLDMGSCLLAGYCNISDIYGKQTSGE